ncbi:hypothetical protein [Oleiphilus messinensis]|uniref:hypothetical protein n=1 Tax=Oleiphilus messinensis TaxID=141451 RepID=UPI000B3B40EB|nr:hypothetical protein [Oleiphilus messinensis]
MASIAGIITILGLVLSLTHTNAVANNGTVFSNHKVEKVLESRIHQIRLDINTIQTLYFKAILEPTNPRYPEKINNLVRPVSTRLIDLSRFGGKSEEHPYHKLNAIWMDYIIVLERSMGDILENGYRFHKPA